MKSFEKIFYPIYKKLQKVSWWVTMVHYYYNRVLPWRKRETRLYRYRSKKLRCHLINGAKDRGMREIKIAFVCDEMTFRDFENECKAVYVNPSNWFQIFESFRPEVFFCESAWSGLDSTWRGRIYKNDKIKFENRRELLNILDYCHESCIKTVFWNKEDPAYFHNYSYNFVDTALKFDCIFTTSQECIELYRRLGHPNVQVLMFGFSPKLFNPINSGYGKGAIFAGSWYADQTERCQDMEECFAMVLQKGIPLTIYDRHSSSVNPNNSFPQKYLPLLNNCIEFNKLGGVLKQFRYAININTIKESQTMFARRVFEIMACNMLVISNESVGLRQLFDNGIWFTNEDFDENSVSRICNDNLKTVFKHHTCKERLRYLLNSIQIPFREEQEKVIVLYNGTESDLKKCQLHFQDIPYDRKYGLLYNGYYFTGLLDECDLPQQQFLTAYAGYEYFIIANQEVPLNMEIEYAIKHFDYIEQSAGIREGGFSYCYVCDCYNLNTLFKTNYLESLLVDQNQLLNKYQI